MPPSDLAAIESTETSLGRNLPSAFREFLLRSNGGQVELLGLVWEVNPVEQIVAITEDARKWPSFPRGGISVADDGFGNHLIFVPSATDSASFCAVAIRLVA